MQGQTTGRTTDRRLERGFQHNDRPGAKCCNAKLIPSQEEDHDPSDPAIEPSNLIEPPSSPKKTFNKRKISDTDQCPIHDHPHTWGVCHSNHYSEYQKKYGQNYHKNNNDSINKPVKTGETYAVHSYAQAKEKHDEKMEQASNNGSILNEEDINDMLND
jgi:hypothetical protein